MQKLIIIAGPSGAGKTTISDYLNKKHGIQRVITHTTRAPRLGEGADAYYFESEASFKKLHLFESVKYGSYHYGSSREGLEKAWEKSSIASLIVDTSGVKSYLDKLPVNQVYFIYVNVSDFTLLKKRLIERGDNQEEILKRINSPEFKRDLELDTYLSKRAHVIVNDEWKKTAQTLDKIVTKLRKD
ncbi:guanylate kinase [Lactobacillus psittaci]|uniref:Gmk, Guanylate kinase n=1 Tax=Lactobacillus psittaci DSM 15354 TaxID=1122152 RepID=A0A0R1S755_9LACO|nr:AAA family ATPase [Lactobacillus psittaci]KRL63364.1 Gmk, Guanylate kinase [Lactobacillus psittaci DSM 15354]